MALKHIIPNKEMDQLVCSSCANYLSVFPVYLTRNNTGAICGRCTPFNKDNFIRDEAYEAIAEFLLFPCRYKNNDCTEELTPQKLIDHEVKCNYRTFECITKALTNCDWLGTCSDILEHFERNHPALLLKTPGFEWHFNTSHRENFLLPFENEFFIVKKEFDLRKQNISCSVQKFGSHSTTERYNYVLKLLSDDRNAWFRLNEESTQTEKNITLNRDYVREKLNDPAFVIAQIDIIKTNYEKAEDSIEKPGTKIEKNPTLNWDLLNELECPICYDIMCPPIYQCTNGHSICKQCKTRLNRCPSCQKDVGETRNYGLEKLTQHMTYPCKFHKSGCNYTSKSEQMSKHEEDCEFGPYDCPLKITDKCNMKINMSQMAEHVDKNHRLFILKSNRITSPFNVDETRETFFLLIYYDKVFRILYKYHNQKFYWTVQLVGPEEESRKFKFDIDIIDYSKNKLKCFLSGFCSSTQDKIVFKDSLKYVMLTYEQIQSFINETVDYNIYITKE